MYDPECEKLARHFLDDAGVHPNRKQELVAALSQHLQDTVESWLEGMVEKIRIEIERRKREKDG